MKRKDYRKPTMKVVKLQHQGFICTSPGQAGTQNYTFHDEEEE